jgi:predicted nucleotidyltransferase
MVISFDNNKLNTICNQNNIASLSLFGSCARGEQTSTSDVDLLVSFGKRVSLFDIARAQNALETVFNNKVDLVLESNLKKRIKPYIYKDLKTIYEKR